VTHPSLEALIEVEDAPGAADVQLHIAQCAECAQEISALRLRRAALKALPRLQRDGARSAPASRAARDGRKRRIAVRASLLATAAALALVALWPTLRAPPGSRHTGAEAVAALISRSQALEADLRALPDPTVVEVEDADARAEVEDEIAWVDQCLAELSASAPDDEREALWKTRIGLLESLIKLRRPPPVLVRL
jgi:hypothetical protein